MPELDPMKRWLTWTVNTTPQMTLTTDLGLSIRVSVFEYVDLLLQLCQISKKSSGRHLISKYRENCPQNPQLPRNEWKTAKKITWKLQSDSCGERRGKHLRLPRARSPGMGEGGDWWS